MREAGTRDRFVALVGLLLIAIGGWTVWKSSTMPPRDMPDWAYGGSAALMAGILCLGLVSRGRQRFVEPEPTAELTGRIPCPSCRESIIPGATICPHCRRPIFAATPVRNAQIQMTIAIATGVGLWLLWKWMIP